MNGYHRRAPFYRSEFAVRDDFLLLGQLLTGEDGLVIDIPSGAGRLLPVHKAHRHDVIMVDIEPAMTEQCRQGIADCGIAGRRRGGIGDLDELPDPGAAADHRHLPLAQHIQQEIRGARAVEAAVTQHDALRRPGRHGLLHMPHGRKRLRR